MAGKLTDLAVKTAKPQEKRYTLFDTGGLYLEVAPNGSKWWRFRYRAQGKQKVMSLGVYPDISLKNAREKRDAARTLIANGGDPLLEREERRLRESALTFDSVLEEWFSRKSRGWSPAYIRGMRLRINRYLVHAFGQKPFSELETSDFLAVLRPIEKQEKHETAQRIAQICGRVCRYAKLSGIIKNNPVDCISEVLTAPQTQHHKTITNPERIGHLLRDIQHYHGRPITGYALRIMPYVFVRSGELRGALWEEIDFDSATWTIPAERMKMRKEHIVPLASQVIKLLEELKFFSGNSALCFPGTISSSRPITDVTLLNSLRRLGYGRDEMCIHGFRSMASTLLNEKGYRSDIIEAQLAHKEKDAIRAAYNHAEYLEERRKMMQEWADYLDCLRKDT